MAASTTIKKAFADFDAEQEWLNRMSGEGRALVAYSNGSYVFVDDEPGAWDYAIEILDQGGKGPRAYLAFLEDAGIEAVAVYAGRAYLRKKSDGTPFDLHSDLASRLEQARRGGAIWSTVLVTQALTGAFILINGFAAASPGTSDLAKGIALAMSIVLIAAAIIEYAHFGRPYRERIRRLKKELSIRE